MDATAPDGSVLGMVDIKGFGHGSHVSKQVSQYENLLKNNDEFEIDKLRTFGHSDGLMSFGGVMIQGFNDHFGPVEGSQKILDPQNSRPWEWGHQVADAYDRGDTI